RGGRAGAAHPRRRCDGRPEGAGLREGAAMTEEGGQWCGDGPLLLALAGAAVSDRKLRLLACACARLALAAGGPAGARPWLERARRAVEAAEPYADGRLGAGGLALACPGPHPCPAGPSA